MMGYPLAPTSWATVHTLTPWDGQGLPQSWLTIPGRNQLTGLLVGGGPLLLVGGTRQEGGRLPSTRQETLPGEGTSRRSPGYPSLGGPSWEGFWWEEVPPSGGRDQAGRRPFSFHQEGDPSRRRNRDRGRGRWASYWKAFLLDQFDHSLYL